MRKLNLIPKIALALIFMLCFVSKMPNTQIIEDKASVSQYYQHSNILSSGVVDVGMAD